MESMEQSQEMNSTIDEETKHSEEKDISGTQDSRRPTIEGQLHRFYKNKKIHFDKQRTHVYYLYEIFWGGLYRSAPCIGDEIKVFDSSMSEAMALEVAKVFRMGWEEEHFFPVKLAQPLLEICLFNREEADLDFVEVTQEMFIKFITPEEKEIIRATTVINQEVLEILNKYCPSFDFATHQNLISLEDACITAAKTVMVTNTKKIAEIWTPVLVGLMEMEQFRFFMKQPVVEVPLNEDDFDEELKTTTRIDDRFILPHTIWKTFFYKWSASKIDFYFSMLKKGTESSYNTCYRCGLENASPQHLLGNQGCERTEKTMSKERHDCILRLVEEELLKAMETYAGHFFRGRDWRYLMHYGKKSGKYPKELRLGNMELFPDVLVYSLELGEVLVMDLDVTLESLVHQKRLEKKKKFTPLVNKLIKKGFKVFESYLVCGCRGVQLKDFFYLFKSFGMTYKKNSRALEKISQLMFTIPYNDYEYLKERFSGKSIQWNTNSVDVSMDVQ